MPFFIALFLTIFITMGLMELSLSLLWLYYVFDLIFG
jgi:hypothetical protein